MKLKAVQRIRLSFGRKLRLAELRRTIRRMPHEKIAVLTSRGDLGGHLVADWFPDSSVLVLCVDNSADLATARNTLRQGHHHVVIDDVQGPMAKRFAWMFHQVHDQGAYISLDNPKIAKHLRLLQRPVDAQTRQADKDWFRVAATRGAIGTVETGRRVTVVHRLGTRYLVDLVSFATASADRTTVDLGIVYPIESVAVSAVHSHGEAWLEASNEGTRWVRVCALEFEGSNRTTIALSGSVVSRHLRVALAGGSHLIKLEVFVLPRHCRLTATDKYAASLRVDGLGERLNSMIAALRLSRLLGLTFKFTWADLLVDDVDHAIDTAVKMFTEEFRHKHLDPELDKSKLLSLPNDQLTVEVIDRLLLAHHGFVMGTQPLAKLLSLQEFPDLANPYSSEFAEIGFTPHLREAVRAGQTVSLSPQTAGIHLRSGDLTHGEYRKWTIFNDKIIPVPIARAIVTRLVTDGFDVVAIGEQQEGLNELCRASERVKPIDDLRPAFLETRAAVAIFDLMVLARCEPLVAATSGFARQASALSGRPSIDSSYFFSIDEQYALMLDDLNARHDRFSPLHGAFNWWTAFHFVRLSLDGPKASAMLQEAGRLDPENGLYPLTEAAWFYRDGNVFDGDRVLADRLVAEWAQHKSLPLLEHFPGRHINRVALEEQTATFESVSDTSAMARIFLATTARARRDLAEADRLIQSAASELESGLLASIPCDLRTYIFSSTPTQIALHHKASKNAAIMAATEAWTSAR